MVGFHVKFLKLIELQETRHKIVWSYIENVQSFNDILHPVVREGLKFMNFDNNKGIEIYHSGDLPARTGIGTSSSFSVGLINALSNLSVTSKVPIGNGILTCNDKKQAIERADSKKKDKGGYAAEAVISVLNNISK